MQKNPNVNQHNSACFLKSNKQEAQQGNLSKFQLETEKLKFQTQHNSIIMQQIRTHPHTPTPSQKEHNRKNYNSEFIHSSHIFHIEILLNQT